MCITCSHTRVWYLIYLLTYFKYCINYFIKYSKEICWKWLTCKTAYPWGKHKSLPRAWNISQIACIGYIALRLSFPTLCLMRTLCCLRWVYHMAPSQSHCTAFSVPRKKTDSYACSTRRVHSDHLLASVLCETCWSLGLTLLKLILLCLFSMWIKCFNQCLCELCFSWCLDSWNYEVGW